MKTIFKINLFTYLFFLLYVLSGYYKDIIIIFFILFIHEMGHYFIMRFYKINVFSITFYPYGGILKSSMLINTNSIKTLIISIGGILGQLILYCIFFLIYKFNIINYDIFNIFCMYNLYIILFNLLPIYPLDGYKIFNSILECFFSFINSLRISILCSFFFMILFFLYLYFYKINNYVIIVFLIVSLINYIREISFLINKFYVERIIYDIKYSGLISVNKIEAIYKNKFNYVNGVSEKSVLSDKFFVNK